ncbi:DNA polymerase III, subunit gamma and tau [Candidatus Woesebacteria bacterium RBG_16_34_12]|uniref:DNA polymerase III subunit gamma/tau n=1 Tax=Candidatus Woesebacteria bacterium RBG_16_34_12 TaxID=1802480 RepID=A0A1F7X7H1_9BACT|nr:MAG: DNA polymerase III, subunit gamma and tau [Candidatus Woesebacteria bacterium RBG_16_34_12]
MTFYLKYRPQRLNDLDSERVRESLIKIIRSKNIPHAFLFSGPKGIGKTSAARILAKIVNCESKTRKIRGKYLVEPCNRCSFCKSITNGTNIDVIELDAASHRGIDDVRALKDAVKLSPASAKMKVYIIDEAHMLTLEASNALLKTLEEPPSHVMFILATTNPEKLIPTIRSRAVTIPFKKATDEEILRSLQRITKGEKIKIEDEQLLQIAEAADGSFRDAAKILEQVVTELKIYDEKRINEFFNKGISSVNIFFEYLFDKKTREALNWLEQSIESGINADKLGQSILGSLQTSLKAKYQIGEDPIALFDKSELVYLIKLFNNALKDIAYSAIEHLPLEIAVIEWCERGTLGNIATKTNVDKKNDPLLSINEENELKSNIKPNKINTKKINKLKTRIKVNSISEEVWLKILKEIRPKNTSTEALLRAAKPIDFDGNTLTLGVFYSFHKEHLEGNPHRDLLRDAVKEVFGNPVKIICRLSPIPQNKSSDEVILEEVENSENTSDSVLTEDNDQDIIKIAKDIFS